MSRTFSSAERLVIELPAAHILMTLTGLLAALRSAARAYCGGISIAAIYLQKEHDASLFGDRLVVMLVDFLPLSAIFLTGV